MTTGCPKCGEPVVALDSDDVPLRADNLTVCPRCFTTLVFGPDMAPRLPTMREVIELVGDGVLVELLGRLTTRLKMARALETIRYQVSGQRGF